MCLIVLKGTPIKEAEEDIICYKQIDVDYNYGIRYYSYIMRFEYVLGLLYTERLEKDDGTNPDDYAYADFQAQDAVLEGLGFPSSNTFFTSWENILPECDFYLKGFHSYKSGVKDKGRKPNVECIIPKGSKYIEDLSGLICSNQIILTKLID